MSKKGLIAPHGGKLVNLVVSDARRAELEKASASMTRIALPDREQCDLELLAVGAMSPLEGFMNEADFHGVCDSMHLAGGAPWSMPITCSIDKAAADKIELGAQVLLTDGQDRPLAVLTVENKYAHDKKKEAEKAYGTTDDAHPGVSIVFAQGDVCLSGKLEVLSPRHDAEFPKFRLTPAQTRAAFEERGWRRVVAFQTRNPIHRAHEYITKTALEIVDGLLVHPLVGETKKGDIPADVRMDCYNVLLDNYYPKDHVALSVFPAAMRYAGPREAIFHAIARKNYGVTHFIVGRDHAGVGDYYGTYDAQHIFSEFTREEMDVTPLFFEHSFFCKKCGNMASQKTCPHGNEDHVFLSGTKVREMLSAGQMPPETFTRPEVAKVLMDAYTKGE